MPPVRADLPRHVADAIERFTGRAWLLPTLRAWWENSHERLFLLTGGPGVGKSMVSAWLSGGGPAPADPIGAASLEHLRSAVSAVHFCQTTSGNSPRAFAESVARQLARSVGGFAGHVATSLSERAQVNVTATVSAVSADHANITGIELTLQLGSLSDEPAFDRVLRDPLKALYASGYADPILLIVDALDESLAYSGTPNLPQILNRLDDLPAPVRLLVTSRDEPEVRKIFRNVPRCDLVLDAPAGTDDVHEYALRRLHGMTAASEGARQRFASRLTERTRGVFLYAAMVLDEIVDRSADDLPDLDLEAYPLPNGLSGLYHDFLTRKLGVGERWLELYAPLLGLIAVAQGDGLTGRQLTALGSKDLWAALLACKQYLTGDLPDGPFHLFHKSFADFLLDDPDNVYYHIDGASMHRRIADHYWTRYQQHQHHACDDYGLFHLPAHAASAGMLDGLMNEPLFLVMADPQSLLRVVTANDRPLTGDASDSVHVYQGAFYHLPSASFGTRASYLQMVAHQSGRRALAERFDRLPFALPFSVRWANWQLPFAATHRVVARNLAPYVRAAVTRYDSGVAIVTSCGDGAVRVWDLVTGALVRGPFARRSGQPTAVAAAQLGDRTLMASASSDGAILVWDLAKAEPIAGPFTSEVYGGAPAYALAFDTHQGRLVAGGNHGNVEVWDIGTGQPVLEPLRAYGGVVHQVAAGECEGQPVILSLHNDSAWRLWDGATGRLMGDNAPRDHGTSGRVGSVALANVDDRFIALTGSRDGTIRAWDLVTQRPTLERTFERQSANALPITALTMGNIAGRPVIVSGNDAGTISVRDFDAGHLLAESTRHHDGGVHTVALATQDGRPVIVSAGDDGAVRAWHVTDESFLKEDGPFDYGRWFGVKSLAIGELHGSPVVVVGGHDGVIHVSDLVTGRPARDPIRVHSLATTCLIPAGIGHAPLMVSVTDEDTLDVTDRETGMRVGSRLYGRDAAERLNLSAGGESSGAFDNPRHIESHSLGRVVRVWDLSTGSVVGTPIDGRYGGHEAVAAAMLEGNLRILTGEPHSTIGIWDSMTGQPIGEPLKADAHTNVLVAVEVDGRPLAVSGDTEGTLRIWDVATGRSIGEPLRLPNPGGLLKAATLRGRAIVGCTFWKALAIIDLASGQPVSPTIETPGYVGSFTLGEVSGRLTIIAADPSGTLYAWDANGDLVGTIDVDASLLTVALAPDGCVIIGSTRGVMAVEWRLMRT